MSVNVWCSHAWGAAKARQLSFFFFFFAMVHFSRCFRCCSHILTSLVVVAGFGQLIGQDVPALHLLAFVLQAVGPVAMGVAQGVST